MGALGTDTFGQRVKRTRERKGIRQIDLASSAGISWRHLIRIEQDAGGATRQATVERIAQALGVSVDQLTSAAEDDEESEPVMFGDAMQRMFDRAVQKAIERRLQDFERVT